jgi:acetoacetyl-CoA synthetase
VTAPVAEGDLLWEPSESFKQGSVMTEYMRWLAEQRGLELESYDDLWRWSVGELEAFWASVVDFFRVELSRPAERILGDRSMPGTRWFEGAEINYAQNVFRHASADTPALVYQSETRPLSELSWAELKSQVASVAAALREMGVKRGDRVVAYMPNMPETVVAFLAAASLGAIWSSCSPDFGVDAVLDRFAQIEPRVLFAVDGYTYGGKPFSRLDVLRQLQERLPTLEHTILVQYLEPTAAPEEEHAITPWARIVSNRTAPLDFEGVPFDHPLWVVYSSGTTGLPKALVHSHGGVVIEHVKLLALHHNLRAGDRLFWYTSTGWMMWNYIVGGLLLGATPVLFDGNPAYPTLDALWDLAQQARIKLFGTSAAYLMNCLKAGLQPGQQHDLSALESIGSTGSPLPAEGFAWVYDSVKSDVWLASVSGGTDVASAFVVGCPLLPVRAGELQCRALGASVESFDDNGQPVIEETGELVLTQPMPSMPVSLWNDPDFSRYRASYFDVYPGVWRHGDWIRLTRRGSAVIQGRSDSTLNRLGIRVGTSEVYTAVESLPEIRDSLVLGLELPRGGYYMPLFVVLADGVELDEELRRKINTTIRMRFSARHVPDEILAVPAIPRTLSDKKMEVPVKKLFMGVSVDKAANLGATRSPEAVEYFAELARQRSPLLERDR